MRAGYLKLVWAAVVFFVLFLGAARIAGRVESSAESPLLPTGKTLHPSGQSLTFEERPLDMVLSADSKTLFVKGTVNLIIIDALKLKELQRLKYPQGENGSMHGIAAVGDSVYISGSNKSLLEARRNKQERWQWERKILLNEKGCNPCGIALSSKKHLAYVCLSIRNTLALVDLDKAAVIQEIPTGVCPIALALDNDEHYAYVANYGGRHSRAGEHVEDSAGTPVLVDERSIPNSGRLSRIDLSSTQDTVELDVGLHPADLKLSSDNKLLFVANANSDSISVVSTRSFKVQENIGVSPHPKLPFGSMPDAICLSEDGKLLFTANGGNNAIAVFDCPSSSDPNTRNALRGFIPSGWFPGALCCDHQYIYVANTKGESSKLNKPDAKKFNSVTNRGSISKIRIPGADELSCLSRQVAADVGVQEMLSSAEEKPRAGRAPVPIPERTGEPSSIEHIVYVIKENRTYDQVFGDMPEGNNDPSLCTYGREVTPNHHALAEEFVLLDNYYCNGVVSADGHQWATQGLVTDYQEKMFGGHPRGYDFGTDPLSNASCNFLWDSVLQRGLSVRNYGEFDFPELVPKTANWFDSYSSFKKNQSVKFTQSLPMERLKKYTCTEYPGWNLAIPDVMRVQYFLKELKQFEEKGQFPNLLIVYLPQDHTAGVKQGFPTPRALVADNDLALGQLVDAISHSRFWPKTAIFVNEDDPQDGWDHVDGHRSLCLVISPFARRQAVLSKFYNQDSVLRTIERILGLPSANQMTASASLMNDCFRSEADLRPYTCKANQIPLDETSVSSGAKNLQEEHKLIAASERLDLTHPDRINEDSFNRILWHASKGIKTRYPSKLAGAHGRGLQKLNLKLVPVKDDD